MSLNKNCVIYDFETLSQDVCKGVIISYAMISFDETRYLSDNPYTFEELVNSAKYIKFNVKDQIENYGRKISSATLKWWQGRTLEAQKQIKPSPNDKLISTFYDFIITNCDAKNVKRTYTRGNTFDPIILDYLMADIGKTVPFYWANVRDTRSTIDALGFLLDGFDSIGGDRFIPSELDEKFIKHNPIHDIALDVIRMQMMVQSTK